MMDRCWAASSTSESYLEQIGKLQGDLWTPYIQLADTKSTEKQLKNPCDFNRPRPLHFKRLSGGWLVTVKQKRIRMITSQDCPDLFTKIPYWTNWWVLCWLNFHIWPKRRYPFTTINCFQTNLRFLLQNSLIYA